LGTRKKNKKKTPPNPTPERKKTGPMMNFGENTGSVCGVQNWGRSGGGGLRAQAWQNLGMN